MRSLRFVSVALIAAYLGAANGRVLAQRFLFESFSQHEGLKNLSIRTIAQDRQGLLWLGTQAGLYRFDGYRFEQVAIPGTENPQYVTGLTVDGSGRVWGSTIEALFYLDDAGAHRVESPDENFKFELTNSLTADPDDPNRIFLVSRHRIYEASATPGAGTSAWPRFSPDQLGENPLLEQVGPVAAQPGGRLWFGCGKEICAAKGNGSRAYGLVDGVPKGPWTELFVDREQALWGRSENHIVRFNPGRQRFEAMDQGIASSLLGVRNPSMIEDSQGRILLNLDRGLARYEGGHWIVFQQKTDFPPYDVTCLFLDRQNSVWVGFDGHGAARWLGYGQFESLTTTNGLTSDLVWNFARDAHGSLWLATESDLMRLGLGKSSPGSERIEPQSSLNTGPMRRIQTLAITPDGHLWTGSDNGKVIDYDSVTRMAKTVAQVSGVFHLLLDGKNRIWISSMSGLYSVDLSRQPRTAERSVSPAPQGMCYGGARDAKGNLWFIADTGLYRLAGSTWTHIRLPSNYRPLFSAQIALARDGTVWLSGVTAPLTQFRINGDAGDEVTHFTSAQVGSNNVLLVAFDQRGWLWVGTDQGVAVYNGSQWRLLTTDDGLAWNDMDSNAFLADTDGSVWVGTSGGASHILHPEELFKISALPLLVSDASIGDVALSSNAPVTVPWGHHPLTAHISTLDFTRAGQTTFRYHIEGLAEDWQDSVKHDLRYPPLAPGAYRLEVVAVDAATGRTSGVTRIAFSILPPWWQTRLMFVSETTVLGLLFFLVWRWTMFRQVARQRRLEELVRSRTAELETEKAELLKARTALEVQARHDALTGLLNHGAILNALELAMRRAVREHTALGVVMGDLDHFKKVNDTYGHVTGDLILQQTAQRMEALIRDYDEVGRYGGEEILLVLPGMSLEAAADRLAAVHSAVCEPPFLVRGKSIRVTCSFGFAEYDPESDDIETLVERADRALYLAKANGRNRIEFCASGAGSVMCEAGQEPDTAA
jgi:diguanylate cyclase (GGDEF)-like protein